MIEKVSILNGRSRYDVFHVWQKSLLKAFLSLDIDADIIPVFEESKHADERTLTLAFNMNRVWSTGSFDHPHLSWLVDHPVFHADYFMPEKSRIPLNPSMCHAANVSRYWTQVGRRLYHTDHLHFLPHAASRSKCIDPADRDHSLDVVFFGSLNDPESLLEKLKSISGPLWPGIQEIMRHHAQTPFYIPLDIMLWQMGTEMGFSKEHICLMTNALFPLLDMYFRNVSRLAALRSIRQIEVHIFGKGPWRECGLGNNFHIHEPVPYTEVLDILSRTRILFNHTPTLHQGMHERILDALASGCAVLSTESAYLAEQFPFNPAIQTFSAANPQQANLLLRRMLRVAHPAARIRDAQDILARHHTMLSRARTIAEWFAIPSRAGHACTNNVYAMAETS